jgi:hypothetical protein
MNAYAWPSLSDACRPYSVLTDHSPAACSIGCPAAPWSISFISPHFSLDLVKLYKENKLMNELLHT